MSIRSGALEAQIHRLSRHLSPVLDAQSSGILESIVVTEFQALGAKTKEMRYFVDERHPLIFKKRNIDGIDLQPDLFCKVRLCNHTPSPILEQNVVLRIWSISNSGSFRPEWDARLVKKKLRAQGDKRVVARYHFDFANAGQAGPVFHIQFGGKPLPNELFWSPDLSVPRITHPPVDLVLASEIVLANFYPEEFSKLRREPEWLALVRESEDIFQKWYFESCHSCISDLTHTRKGRTLLSDLWNIKLNVT